MAAALARCSDRMHKRESEPSQSVRHGSPRLQKIEATVSGGSNATGLVMASVGPPATRRSLPPGGTNSLD